MQPDIPFFIQAIFIALVFILLIFILKGLDNALLRTYDDRKKARKIFSFACFCLFLWLAFLAFLSQQNILNNFSSNPPRFIIVFLPPLIATIILAGSKSFANVLLHIPVKNLIYIQTFRVAMEVILWLLYFNTVIPRQMTFEGRNYDILTGLSALFTAYYYSKGVQFFNRKWFLILWNTGGLILLANIVIVAILSAPFPFRHYMNEPANTVIAYFPFVWLPGFVVPVAYAIHVFTIKQVLLKEK